jgi:iron-sulfur cluster assembly protein
MPITLTESAASKVKSHLNTQQGYEGLKLSVKNAGCSGLAYILDYAEKADDGDQIFESNGVKVMVSDDHMQYLDGTQIDYVEDGLSAAFHFNNPKVTEQCGCGESFTVK